MSNNSTVVSCFIQDDHFVLTVQLIVGGWASLVVCLFGIIGNALSLVVLGTKRMRSMSTNTYLMAMATVNLLWLILFLIFYAIRYTVIVPYFLSGNDECLYGIYNQLYHRLSPYTVPLMNTLQLCFIYYTVAASIDRYLFVSLGVRATHYCTVRNALIVIFSLTLFSIVFILPHWFKYHAVRIIDIGNRTRYQLSLTKIGRREFFREVLHVHAYIPIVYMIPFIVLIVVNIFTVRGLVEFRDEHHRLLSTPLRHRSVSDPVQNRRHLRVTIMLIAVVILFLVCRLPMLVNHLYEVKSSLTDDDTRQNQCFHCRIRRTFNTFVNFLQTINATGNLIIYFVCYYKFRETSHELMTRLLARTRPRANENVLPMMTRRSRTSTRTTNID